MAINLPDPTGTGAPEQASPAAPSLTGADPFFLCYDPRSGSTFLAKLLVERTAVVIPPEVNFVPRLAEERFSLFPPRRRDQFIEVLRNDAKWADLGIDPETLRKALDRENVYFIPSMVRCMMQHFLELQGATGGIPYRWGFKKDYQHHADRLTGLFPNATFLCLIRDGRAVFRSKKTSIYSVTGKPFLTEAQEAARMWVKCLEQFERMKAERPEKVFTIRYEDLILDTDAQIARIAEDLGLQATSQDECRYEIPSRYGNLHENISKPPLAEKINQWRDELSEQEIAAYEEVAGPYLAKYGYS